MSAMDEFRAFITRGNVIDMAVGVVIGLAFQAVINSLVTNLINPLIGLPGHTDFSKYSVTLNGSTFLYGAFINSVISFILIALVVFFLLVQPAAKMAERRKAREAAAPPTTRDCPACLSKVPIKATRCAYCTSALPAA